MKLSPRWVPRLTSAGFGAMHWQTVGRPDAPDSELARYAAVHRMTVLTHDLDFGAMLAMRVALRPSVVQLRIESVSPDDAGDTVERALNATARELLDGALVTIGERGSVRIRKLPIGG